MNRIASAIDAIITCEFFPFLQAKIGVNNGVLLAAWHEFNESKEQEPAVEKAPTQPPPQGVKRSPSQPVSPGASYSVEELECMKIKELKGICESLRVPISGVKQQLIKRIMEQKSAQRLITFQSKSEPPVKKVRTIDEPVHENDSSSGIETTVNTSGNTSIEDDEKKVGKLQHKKFRLPDVNIVKNQNGHWINEETKIVFTSDEEYDDGIRCRLAIGYEDDDGHVEDLNADKIELCNMYGFRYREPSVIAI